MGDKQSVWHDAGVFYQPIVPWTSIVWQPLSESGSSCTNNIETLIPVTSFYKRVSCLASRVSKETNEGKLMPQGNLCDCFKFCQPSGTHPNRWHMPLGHTHLVSHDGPRPKLAIGTVISGFVGAYCPLLTIRARTHKWVYCVGIAGCSPLASFYQICMLYAVHFKVRAQLRQWQDVKREIWNDLSRHKSAVVSHLSAC